MSADEADTGKRGWVSCFTGGVDPTGTGSLRSSGRRPETDLDIVDPTGEGEASGSGPPTDLEQQMQKQLEEITKKYEKQEEDHRNQLAEISKKYEEEMAKILEKANEKLKAASASLAETNTIRRDLATNRRALRDIRVQQHRRLLCTWAFCSYALAIISLAWLDGALSHFLIRDANLFGCVVLVVVSLFQIPFIVFLAFRRVPLPRWLRVICQTGLVAGSRGLTIHSTDLHSLAPATLMSLYTVSVYLLMGVPDDFSFYLSFVGLGASGFLGHFHGPFEYEVYGWLCFISYVAAMLLSRLAFMYHVVEGAGVEGAGLALDVEDPELRDPGVEDPELGMPDLIEVEDAGVDP